MAPVNARLRLLVAVLATAWIIVGTTQAWTYLHRYDVYRGFPRAVTPAGVPRGTVHVVHFRSAATGHLDQYEVYLPPGYRRAVRHGGRFPVLYLLHGFPGTMSVFTRVGAIDVRANVLIHRHRIPPLIMVMPGGAQGVLHGDSEWADTPSGHWMSFVTDVVHDVDHRFATIADRGHRAIAGDSEGGYGAINIALHHLDVFGIAESWSGYFTQSRSGPFARATPAQIAANSPASYVSALAPRINRLGLRAWLFQGRADSDDPALLASFAARLRAAGAGVHTALFAGGHDWGLWRREIPRMLVAAGRWFQAP